MASDKEMEVILITKRFEKSEKYGDSKQAYTIFKDILNYEKYELHDKEHFWVMGIDNAGFIVCIYIVALGGGNQVKLTAAEMLDIAVSLKSKKIILAHNHPSGNVEPSENDILTTNMLYHCCYPFGIEVLDHLIITIDKYGSLEELGIMDKVKNDTTYKQLDEVYTDGQEKKAIEMAKKMLADDIDINIISKYTELTEEEIIKIKDNLK